MSLVIGFLFETKNIECFSTISFYLYQLKTIREYLPLATSSVNPLNPLLKSNIYLLVVVVVGVVNAFHALVVVVVANVVVVEAKALGVVLNIFHKEAGVVVVVVNRPC